MKPIRILLVDDHKIIRRGIRAVLRHDKELIIVGEAQNGQEALDLISSTCPDIVIMDIDMPVLSGIETTEIINRKYPEVKVLILSVYNDPKHVKSLLVAGVMGYIPKSSETNVIRNAITTVHQGGTYFHNSVSDPMLREMPQRNSPSHDSNVNLTPRELEVLHSISKGLTNIQIAKNLSVSKRTVDTHRQNLLGKLGVNNTASLIRYAVQHKLI